MSAESVMEPFLPFDESSFQTIIRVRGLGSEPRKLFSQ